MTLLDISEALIAAGGQGTRLRPLTLEKPKALIDVNGKTLTERVLDILGEYNVKKVILSVCYMSDKVKNYFGDGSSFGFDISYCVEERAMGTAGALILMPKPLSTFLMLNGDVLFDIDLEKMYEFHNRNKALATIALTYVDDPSRYGVVKMDGERIEHFVEKPLRENAPSNLVSAGYYLIEPIVCDLVAGKEYSMMEKDVFPKLALDGKLFGYYDPGLWFDTGTFESLELVRTFWRGITEKRLDKK